MDLDRYGGGSRCLLRLRENDGKPGLSDQAFIADHLAVYPEWQARPGAADVGRLFELAKQLEVADEMDVFRDFGQVLAEYRAGNSVLVCTERAPRQTAAELVPGRQVMLLEAMDEAGFTAWCPYPSGQAEVLTAVPGLWWDRWMCIGLVFRRAAKQD